MAHRTCPAHARMLGPLASRLAVPTTLDLVAAARTGDGPAAVTLYDAVYDELRRLARRVRTGATPETLNTTALVHEAYLKMADGAGYEDRAHFLGVAAKAMRHVVIDHVRRQRADKRGGDAEVLPLRETLVGDAPDEDLLALDEALSRFAEVDERGARVIECRFFGGLTIEETAAALGVSTPTVERSWRSARAWLVRELRHEP